MKYNLQLILLSAFLFFSILLSSCKSKNQNSIPIQDEHEILNEDSLELAQAYALQSKIPKAISVHAETQPIQAQSEDDAADDPAIWYNKDYPNKSLIFGSNKKGGLVSYDLEGKQVNYYKLGSINNVDITYDYPLSDKKVAVLGCSNRTTQAIDLFVIKPDGNLFQLIDSSYQMDTNKVDDIYGFCFAHTAVDHYAFINGKNGLMQQYRMIADANKIKLQLVREVQFESQTEGMVTDNATGKLYVGEEGKGVWMLDIASTSTLKVLIEQSGENNKNIAYDIEGLTIYRKNGLAYLFASSQGNFSYAVFDINRENEYLGSFKVSDHSIIDGVEETDGIDIIGDSLSVEFPKGIFVAQDGFNYDQDSLTAQNFKYVEVGNILSTIAAF